MRVEDKELVYCMHRLPRGTPLARAARTNNPFFIEMCIYVDRAKKLPANGRKAMLHFTSISGKILPSNIHGSLLST